MSNRGERRRRERERRKREKAPPQSRAPATNTAPATTHDVNGYDCPECGETTWTVDIHEGVTPALFGCRATPGCMGLARSRFYRVPDDHPAPIVEWYRMTDEEARRLDRKYPGTWQHHEAGGLGYRYTRIAVTSPPDSESESP